MHDPQETYDISGLALIAQGRPSISETGLCRYLCDDGCRCAVGHLLPADLTNDQIRRLEGFGVGTDQIHAVMSGHSRRLASDLQSAHDDNVTFLDEDETHVDVAEWRVSWLEEVCRVAIEHGLSDAKVVAAARAAWGEEVLS